MFLIIKRDKMFVNVMLTIVIGWVRWIINGFSRKFLKPLLRRSLVDWVDYSNSCNPYPAQRMTMLKNCSVFLYFFQMALYIHLIHPFGAYHD